MERGEAYGSILDTLTLATLKSNTTTLMLETLRSNETLDFGGFGVWFFAFTFRLDFAANDEFANLYSSSISILNLALS